MHCYECLQNNVTREAIGLCHHCSAALCAEHICVIDDPVTGGVPLVRTVVLPKQAQAVAVWHLQSGARATPVGLHGIRRNRALGIAR